MILGSLVIVALVGGLVSTLLGVSPGSISTRAATGVGVVAALACLVLSLVTPTETLSVDAVSLTSGAPVRLLALGWSATLALTALASAGVGIRPVVGPGLLALGGSVVALAANDPTVAFAALAASGVAAAIVPALAPAVVAPADGGRRGSSAGAAGGGVVAAAVGSVAWSLLATTGAALVAIALVAWARSPVGPFAGSAVVGVQDATLHAVAGFGIVAMAAVVAVRSGAIPAHLWLARLAGATPSLAIPSLVAWGGAAFTLVAIEWSAGILHAAGTSVDELDRWLVIGVGVVGLVLAALATALHDDLEHVLGYWLVQTAGLTLLGFATAGTLDPRPLDNWLLPSAAIASGLAAWIALAHWAFGPRAGIGSLSGWARRSPALAAALVVLLIAGIGLPGTALGTARAAIAEGALPGWPGILVSLLAVAGTLVALGRILVAGLRSPAGDVAGASLERLGVLVVGPPGWSRSGLGWWLRRWSALVEANLGLALGLVTVLLAVVGLAIAIVGTGTTSG